MYQLLLIHKYLRKRRIAWVALGAVTLCTAMVLVIISVMGGWLRMFEVKAHALSGDLILTCSRPTGFAYYQQLADRLQTLPEVDAAVPLIRSFGLITVGKKGAEAVHVFGFPPDQLGKINQFGSSLDNQYKRYIDEAQRPETSAARRTELLAQAKASLAHPSFAKPLPPERYDARIPRSSRWAGMIAASGVTGVTRTPANAEAGRDAAGNAPRGDSLQPVKLSVMNLNATSFTQADIVTSRPYWIVDNSHTGVSLDAHNVYVPLEMLQADLGMGAENLPADVTGNTVLRPAKVHELHVYAKPGYSSGEALRALQEKVGRTIDEVFDEAAARERQQGLPGWSHVRPDVQTWRQSGTGRFMEIVQKQKALVVVLFAIVCLVAVFLVFCILYMIVVEKTRDIGIVKAVGATPVGVAGVFLGYGLVIGVIGAGMGLLAAYLIVLNINGIHAALGRFLGIQIWKADVYLFDTIPNAIDPKEAAIIVAVAIVSSIFGAVVPAIRAARMNPVEAVRYE